MMRQLNLALLVAAAVALTAIGAAAQSGPSITVFNKPNFGGASRTFGGPQYNLNNAGMGDQIASVVIRTGSWRLCDQADFGQPCVTLNPGRYPNLRTWGLENRISSLGPVGWNNGPHYPPPPPPGGNWSGGNNGGWVGPAGQGDVILFEDDNFRGDARSISAPVRNLTSLGFNDRASSVIVNRGRWMLCDQGDFGPPCITLTPGRYSRLSDRGMNDRVSSLRPF
jgi:hypothetical protein